MQLTAVGNKILVHIDKKAQRKKTTLSSGIIVAPAFEYMQYFLQVGEIRSIGAEVIHPDVRIGRTAIIHHSIEADTQFLMHEEPNGDELRIVWASTEMNNHLLYGVIDEEGNLIPGPQFVFVYPEESNLDTEAIVNPNDPSQVMQVAVRKIEGSMLYTAELEKEVDKEVFITCKVAAVATGELDLVPGDIIMCQSAFRYPLEILGKMYWIIQKEFIDLKISYDN